MAKVKLRDIQEGMILADDVIDQNGMLILSSGQNITDKHLRTFKAWGVTEVNIEDDRQGETEVCLTEKNAENVSVEVKKQVDELFRYTEKQHPAMAELMEICILRKMESL